MFGARPAAPARRRTGSLACCAALGWFVACGGNAAVDSSNQAGAASIAGASNSAGASPTAGWAGTSAADACTAPQEPGQCEAYIPSFWHNPKTGLCEPFVFGGCGGNANRYPSRDACMEACPAITDDWAACVNDSNCSRFSTGCCGECEPVASERLVAVNFAHSGQYLDSRCAVQPPCVSCPPVSENEQTEKYFKPVCRNARCTLLDIRESPLTECQKTSDCRLRDGAECCPECDGAGWVALNGTADLCDGAPTACDACASPLPTSWAPACHSGRCELAPR